MTTLRFRYLTAATLALIAPMSSAHAAIDLGGSTGDTGGSTSTTPTVQPTFLKTYSKSGLFGSTDWGAGYSLTGRFSATPAHDDKNDQLTASLGLETYAKINSGYLRLFSARTSGSTEAKRRTDLSFTAYVGSAAIYNKSYSSTTSTYTFLNVTPIDWPVTFFSNTVNLSVGPIPVTFTVKATGDINVGLSGKISNIGIEASGTPSGQASLYASAAIGGEYCLDGACIGASAGVYSDVKLLQASAPANGAVWWSLSPYGGALVSYQVGANLSLHSLDGELGVYAEACLVDCLRESATLISWTGFAATYAIANWSGSSCFVGTCSSTLER